MFNILRAVRRLVGAYPWPWISGQAAPSAFDLGYGMGFGGTHRVTDSLGIAERIFGGMP